MQLDVREIEGRGRGGFFFFLAGNRYDQQANNQVPLECSHVVIFALLWVEVKRHSSPGDSMGGKRSLITATNIGDISHGSQRGAGTHGIKLVKTII